MIQILQEGQKKPSFAKQIGMGLQSAMETGGQFLKDYQQQKNMAQALQQAGIDPSVMHLPPEAQKALFANKFATEKPLNELQKADLSLKQQKLLESQKRDQLFNRLMGRSEEQNVNSAMGNGELQNSRKFSSDELRELSAFAGQPGEMGVIGNIAKSELENIEKSSNRDFEREKMTRKEETELSKPVLLEMNAVRKNIPLQEQSILDIKEATLGTSLRDYIADVFGFEPMRTAEGAKLKTAIKDFFLSDLSRAGARPNMWIEQQLADALPKVGRSTEANLITAEGMQFKVDLAKKRLELIDKIANSDREKYGYVKGDIDSRAYNEMKKYVIDRQSELKKNMEEIKKDAKKGKVKPGTKLTNDKALEFLQKFSGDREKAENYARELGYDF